MNPINCLVQKINIFWSKTNTFFLLTTLLFLIPEVSHATALSGMVDKFVTFATDIYKDLLPLVAVVVVFTLVTSRWKAAGTIVIFVLIGGFLFSDLDTVTSILNPFS